MKQRNAGVIASYFIVIAAAVVIALALILPVSTDLGSALTGFYRGAFGYLRQEDVELVRIPD